MPGTLGYGWHESNRGEYLAQYFLAALGVSAPVIRQEDIGVDFFCSLAEEKNKKLTFHSPFMVQHGADGSKRFAYGGYKKTTKAGKTTAAPNEVGTEDTADGAKALVDEAATARSAPKANDTPATEGPITAGSATGTDAPPPGSTASVGTATEDDKIPPSESAADATKTPQMGSIVIGSVAHTDSPPIPGNASDAKWRAEEIEWLFSQELPLFVCVTNREEGRFQLYSTSAMWLLRYQFGNMNSVVLCPDDTHNPLTGSKRDKIGVDGDGFEYHVPLGRPVVDMSFLDVSKEKRLKAIECLRLAIAVEQTNITLRRMGVHVASWFPNIIPNDPNSFGAPASAVFWNGDIPAHVERQIKSLKDILITLVLNIQAQAQVDTDAKIERLTPIFGFYEEADIPTWILARLPKQVRSQLQK